MPNAIDFTLSIPTPIPTALCLRVYAERALYWPAGNTLIITDPHFGKAESYRHLGIPIPSDLLTHDLARLSHILHHTQAQKLVVLGDFFHTRQSQSDFALGALEEWRSQHAALTITLVQGNHDIHAGPPPDYMDITTVNEPHYFGPFVYHHHPQDAPNLVGYILAGHLHPSVLLRDRDSSTLRLASFIFGRHQAILPAFGNFTGSHNVYPSAGDRVFALANSEILEIPTTRPRPASARR